MRADDVDVDGMRDRCPRRRWLAGLLIACLLTPVLVALWLVLLPRTDEPGSSDVIVVLGPSWPERVADATRLMDDGRASALVVSAHPEDTRGVPPDVCRRRMPYPVYCFDPDPATTQGEARAVERLAQEHDWHSFQVITFRPHIERARLIVGRCVEGRVTYLQSSEAYDPVFQSIYHALGFVKAWARPGC